MKAQRLIKLIEQEDDWKTKKYGPPDPNRVSWDDLSPEQQKQAYKDFIADGNKEPENEFYKFVAPGIDWDKRTGKPWTKGR